MTAGAGPRFASRSGISSAHTKIAGPVGSLEAIVDTSRGPVESIAIVCHPHPLHQGTMHNKVAHTLARYFVRRGALAVRFNFRGVGASSGVYGGGDGEADDAAAVIDWARARCPDVPLFLAGFSFGSMVSIRVAPDRDVAALVTVAPAIRFFRRGFAHPGCPWLVIQGMDDEVGAATDVQAWCAHIDPQPSLCTVTDAGHFFHGKLNTISAAIDDFLTSLSRSASSSIEAAPC